MLLDRDLWPERSRGHVRVWGLVSAMGPESVAVRELARVTTRRQQWELASALLQQRRVFPLPETH